jgi:hypothetical protein
MGWWKSLDKKGDGEATIEGSNRDIWSEADVIVELVH